MCIYLFLFLYIPVKLKNVFDDYAGTCLVIISHTVC